MNIIFNESTKEFHIYNDNISYIMKILRNNQIGQLYFGKKVKHKSEFGYLAETPENRPMCPCLYEDDYTFSLEYFKQEYPSYGTGDYRYPAFEIKQKNGSTISNFEYVSHEIFKGKKKLNSLPATYSNEDESMSLEIKLVDKVTLVEIVLSYSIFKNYPVITRNVKFKNCGDSEVYLTRALSLNLDLPDSNYEWIHLSGSWGRERYIKTQKVEQGIQGISSLRGTSGHMNNPFIALKRPETTEFSGEIIGLSFVYSGNFLAQIEVDTYDVARVSMGINPFNFTWYLEKDEEFQTPEAVMVYSRDGINGMSQAFHKLYSKHLVRGNWKEKPRPILINNWEGTYFDFTEEKLLEMAKIAKQDGIELFVLDDGWFGTRNNDKEGLGDWFSNTNKLKNGVEGLSKKIEEIGLKFGLWIEPEMVNKNSNLYREHPDWIISTPERTQSHGRNQYVLNFSRKEVVEYIYTSLHKLIKNSKISYIKWDMNRCITECYSRILPSERQGEVFHRYILGVYSLYERLIKDFPHILFESCASGGGRFDPGMLYYAPQTWTSDNTDAIERLKIQYGTSIVYPISSMGAHISVCPNHQLQRVTPFKTRGNVAFFGAFGYELDITKFNEDEHIEISKQINFYKKYREVFQYGTFYRLLSPFKGNYVSWMVVSEDKKVAIIGYYKILNEANSSFKRLKLQGLNEDYNYKISSLDKKNTPLAEYCYGDELMNIGLITSDSSCGEVRTKERASYDFDSNLYVLEVE